MNKLHSRIGNKNLTKKILQFSSRIHIYIRLIYKCQIQALTLFSAFTKTHFSLYVNLEYLTLIDQNLTAMNPNQNQIQQKKYLFME